MRLPLDIKITQGDQYLGYSGQGEHITVYLPRTFEGPIRAETRTSTRNIKYSASVEENLTRLYDVDSVHCSFIGHCEPSHSMQGPGANWEGDELNLVSHSGNIYINYEDDPDPELAENTGFSTTQWLLLSSVFFGSFLYMKNWVTR